MATTIRFSAIFLLFQSVKRRILSFLEQVCKLTIKDKPSYFREIFHDLYRNFKANIVQLNYGLISTARKRLGESFLTHLHLNYITYKCNATFAFINPPPLPHPPLSNYSPQRDPVVVVDRYYYCVSLT